MKVLVTGASGFVGTHVLNELLDRDVELYCLGRSPLNMDKAKWLKFDLHKDELSLDFLPDKLIHMSWQGLPNYNGSFHLEENLNAQKKFLQSIIDLGVRDITVTGTCLEYGMQNGCLAEEHAPEPTTTYGRAKNDLRIYIQEQLAGSESCFKWLRLFYMYGPGQRETSLIPLINKAVEDGEAVFNMSGGKQIRDFIPVKQMAHLIVSCALQTKFDGIFNCCSGRPQSLEQFILEYLKKNNLKIELNKGHYPYTTYEPMEFWGSIEKLNKIINHESNR